MSVCKYCGGKVPGNVSSCPNCGSPIGREATSASEIFGSETLGARDREVQLYMMANSKKLPIGSLKEIKERLLESSESQWSSLRLVKLKDPIIMLLLHIFLGMFGVTSFMLGDHKNGRYKVGLWIAWEVFYIMMLNSIIWAFVPGILIGLCVFIWWGVDLAKVQNRVLECNEKTLRTYLDMN